MDPENAIIINDLRIRMKDGYEPTDEEMLTICDQIRANRRSAAAQPKPIKAKKPKAATKLTQEERNDLIDNLL